MQAQLAPRLAAVVRPDFEDLPGARPADRLQSAVLVKENARLNRRDLFAVVERRRRGPGACRCRSIARSGAASRRVSVLEPASRSPLAQLHRLVLDRSEDAVGKARRRRPGPAAVGGRRHHAPPRAGARSDLVEEQQRARSRAGTAPDSTSGSAARPTARRWRPRPAASTSAVPAARPRCRRRDCVRPCRRTRPRRGRRCVLDNRRRVARRKRRGLEDELRRQDGSLLRGRRNHERRTCRGEREPGESPNHDAYARDPFGSCHRISLVTS